MTSFFRTHKAIRNLLGAGLFFAALLAPGGGCPTADDVKDTQTVAAVSSEAGAVNAAQTAIPATAGGMNLSSGHK